MVLLVALCCMAGLAATAALWTRWLGRNAGYPLAVGFLAVGALLSSRLGAVAAGESVTVAWRWLPTPDTYLALRMDGLSKVFALLVLGVGALIMLYCPRYLSGDSRHTRTY